MSWELHKKKNKEKYAIYSTIVDDYITPFTDKDVIENYWFAEKVKSSYNKVQEYMKEVDEEV